MKWLFLSLAACLILPLPAEAKRQDVQWHNVGPGGGGWLPSICISPHDNDLMFVGCDVAGLFRSTRAGASWHNQSLGLSDYFVSDIVVHPVMSNVVFASTWSGVNKSDDAGLTWRAIRSGFPQTSAWRYSCPIACVRFDPENPSVVYAFRGCSRGRVGASEQSSQVFRSKDGGETFERIDADGCLPQTALIVDAAVLTRKTLLVTVSGKGVYRSDDAGRTWQESSAGLPHGKVAQLAAAPSDSRVVYLAVRLSGQKNVCDSGVYKSVDEGRSWRNASAGLPQFPPQDGSVLKGAWPKCLAVHPKDPETVFAGINGWAAPGIAKTTNGGLSWQMTTDEKTVRDGWLNFWGPAAEALSIGRESPYPLAFSTGGYVYRSDDLGNSWSQRYTKSGPNQTGSTIGLETTVLFSIGFDRTQKGRKYFGFWDVGLLVSDNDGRNLRRSVSGLSREDANNCMGVVQAADNPNVLWGAFGQWGQNDGIVAKSEDRGTTWRAVGVDSGWVRASATDLTLINERAPYVLACCARGKGIALTDDGGSHWSYVSTNALPRVRDVTSICSDAGVLFAGVTARGKEFGEVWTSSDAGRSWMRLSPENARLPDIKRLRIFNQELFVVARECSVAGKGHVHGGVWQIEERGRSWRKVFTNRFAADFLVMESGAWAVATTDHQFHDNSINDGVLLSRDQGQSWQNISGDTLTHRNVIVLAEDAHHRGVLWAGTQGAALFACRIGK